MFAVTVTFTLRPGMATEFLPLMKANAATSIREEPGCRQFDICRDPARPDEVFLYELYARQEDFRVHLESAHFRSFDAATVDMIAAKAVSTYDRVWP